MKISFIMPSLFPDLASAAIRQIGAVVRDFDFEVVVASPVRPDGDQVVWVQEDQPRGNCPANAQCYAASSGDLIVYIADDIHLTPEWRSITLPYFLQRCEEIPDLLGGFYMHPTRVGTVFGYYYPWFGMAMRSAIERAGGFFNPEFSAHFGDSDLGLRFWRMGGRCELLPGNAVAVFDRANENRSGGTKIKAPEAATKQSKKAEDFALFRKLWGHDLGRGWQMNVLRDFSHDIEPDLLAVFCRDNTVLWPHPMFGDIVKTYYRNTGFDLYFTYWDGGHPQTVQDQ
jgi:hypothetical protein